MRRAEGEEVCHLCHLFYNVLSFCSPNINGIRKTLSVLLFLNIRYQINDINIVFVLNNKTDKNIEINAMTFSVPIFCDNQKTVNK